MALFFEASYANSFQMYISTNQYFYLYNLLFLFTLTPIENQGLKIFDFRFNNFQINTPFANVFMMFHTHCQLMFRKLNMISCSVHMLQGFIHHFDAQQCSGFKDSGAGCALGAKGVSDTPTFFQICQILSTFVRLKHYGTPCVHFQTDSITKLAYFFGTGFVDILFILDQKDMYLFFVLV